MDRSYLSQPQVIAASRAFVCIRLTTYEDEAEMNFLRSLYTGRSGDAENTTFSILAPDGKKTLVRTGRSAREVFADAGELAQTMTAIAHRYRSRETLAAAALPLTADVRLGLDVAASDGQPLVVVLSANEQARAMLEAKVSRLAWSPEFIGRLVYASAASVKELAHVEGIAPAEGVLTIAPDTFGLAGKVVRQLGADESAEQLAAALRATLADHPKGAKNARIHRAQGIRNGKFWETKLPVTDLEEAAARERTKRKIEQEKR